MMTKAPNATGLLALQEIVRLKINACNKLVASQLPRDFFRRFIVSGAVAQQIRHLRTRLPRLLLARRDVLHAELGFGGHALKGIEHEALESK